MPNGVKLMILQFIDEASKYHAANILRQARCANYANLGKCDAKELIAAATEWARYMDHPACFHAGKEGCFHSEECMAYCGVKLIEINMADGEAH